MAEYYAVRWHDSDIYTSVNSVEYVLQITDIPRPSFYQYLVYELIRSDLSFAQLTRRLPFDSQLKHVSLSRLHDLEKAKLRYHIKALRQHLRDH